MSRPRPADPSEHARQCAADLLTWSSQFRSSTAAPARLADHMDALLADGARDPVTQLCPHGGPETGAVLLWPSFDATRRCGSCLVAEVRAFSLFSTVECWLCHQRDSLAQSRHYVATSGRNVLVVSVCPTCLEHPPGEAA